MPRLLPSINAPRVRLPLVGFAFAVVIFVPVGALIVLESRPKARVGALSGASR